MVYPETRPRRLRTSSTMRKLVCETRLNPADLMYPLFVCPGREIKDPIGSMTDCFHLSAENAANEAKEVAKLGIPAVILFGLPEHKDPTGSGAWSPDSAVAESIKRIKEAVPELVVATDVCLCAYTDHGHCGVIENGRIENDKTCDLLGKMALAHVRAGADIIAPSDMMDGRVGVIRKVLDAEQLVDTAIMAYSAKYASAYYGPFRDAVHSIPSEGDRKSYQMDPGNSKEAMREIRLDIEEGADIVMVKPALAYLDIIRMAQDAFEVPVAAYNVSGEYMMLNAAADAGLIDREQAIMETLLSFKRAGADIIITYFAKTAAQWLS
ncbi:MAG: delta-aminolevulinic acid dehydratase [Planctomycetales bacterium 4572_13]|nr:MAG: delta-aminolevulinic acid dehydratase [Planctomycetales bacterium 4572_13]